MKYIYSNILKILLCINSILFLSYLLFLGFYNRMAVDDFCFIHKMNEYGIFKSTYIWYIEWSGRFTSFFMINLMIKLNQVAGTTLLTFSLLILLMVYSIYYFVSIFIENKFKVLLYSCTIFIVFINYNSNIDDFLWTTSASYNILCIPFLLLGYSLLLSKSKKGLFLAPLFFFFIGGAVENISLYILLLLILSLLVNIYFKNSFFNNNAIIISAIALLVAFIIMYLAPGNEIRMQQSNNTMTFSIDKIISSLVLTVKSVYAFTFWTKPVHLKFLILIFPVSLYMGLHLRQQYIISNASLIKVFAISFFLLQFSKIVYFFPMCFALGSIDADRSWAFIDFITVLYWTGMFTLLGALLFNFNDQFIMPAIIALLVNIIFTVDFIKTDYKIVPQYAKAYDERMTYIMKMKDEGYTGTLELEKLPEFDHKCIKSADISNHPDLYWHTLCVRESLDLPFDLKVKE